MAALYLALGYCFGVKQSKKMPHIHLRTSANLVENVDVVDILASLVGALSLYETIDPASIKAYHTLHTNWTMGEGAESGFATVQLLLAEGRDALLLEKVGDAIFAALKRGFAASAEANEANFTVEIREFPKANYRKQD